MSDEGKEESLQTSNSEALGEGSVKDLKDYRDSKDKRKRAGVSEEKDTKDFKDKNKMQQGRGVPAL